MKISKLEAFCRIAEADKAAVEAGLMPPPGVTFSMNGYEMFELAAEIRELQRRAALVSATGVDIDGARAAETHTDGWIEWGGGERPVRADALVETKFRSTAVPGITPAYGATPAHHLRWSHDGGWGDILAYRVVGGSA